MRFLRLLAFVFTIAPVTLAAQPCSTPVWLGDNQILCPGEVIVLDITDQAWNVGPPSGVYWSTGATGYTITITSTGYYSVTGDGGCAHGSIWIYPPDSTAFHVYPEQWFCQGKSVTIHLGFTDGSISWSDGNTDHNRTISVPGTYSATVDVGCAVLTTSINVSEHDTSDQYMPEIVLCPGEAVTLTQPDGYFTAIWSNGVKYKKEIQVTKPGLYWVDMHSPCRRRFYFPVTDDGCKPVQGCEPQLPNVFTPNYDGAADEFRDFSGCAWTTWNLTLMDRWGKTVWVSSNVASGWNGISDGNPMPDGVYFWTLQYGNAGTHGNISGSLTLLR